MLWEWTRNNEKDLAKFVNRKALAVFNEPVPLNGLKLQLLKNKQGREEIIKSIYEYLKTKKIEYDKPRFKDNNNIQIIRNPQEILVSDEKGTCLDLSLLFGSFCLGYGLLPLIIIIKGHAFVAVSLSLILEEWASGTSQRGILHDNGGLLAKESGRELLKTWITNEHYVAIECTGFVKANFGDSTNPEATGRDSEGYLPYDRAKKAGEEQLNKLTNGSREFEFAVDIAICSCGLTIEPHDFDLPSRVDKGKNVDKFSQRFPEIIASSKVGNIVPFLGPGINPKFYLNLAESLENKWGQLNKTESETLIPEMIVTPCQKCVPFLENIKWYCPEIMEGKDFCSTYHEQNIAQTRMKIRRFSQKLYDYWDCDTFFDELKKIIEQEISNTQNNQIYDSLSIHKGTEQVLPYQLIVTTNVDDILETALENEGRNFDLVYFVADGLDKGEYKYKRQNEPPQIIKGDFNLPISTKYRGTNTIPNSRTIILKLYGDWQDYFVITRDHFNFFLTKFTLEFPPILKLILSTKKVLFLGYSPSNSLELQMIINALYLYQSDKLGKSNLVHHQSFVPKVDEKFWENKQVTLTSLEDWSLEDFIDCMNKTEEN